MTETTKKIGRPPGKKSYHNALARSPHHEAIMGKYREMRGQSASVNLIDFHKEHVEPLVPGYQYESFRKYIRRIEAEIQEAIAEESPTAKKEGTDVSVVQLPSSVEVQKLRDSILSMNDATKEGLAIAMNIGLSTLMDIATGKVQMSAKDRAELLFKAMKAQDSRVSTAAKLRRDDREQAAFEREFGEAAYIG